MAGGNKQTRSEDKGELNRGGLGCLGVAMLAGFVLGLNAGRQVVPPTLSWIFAISFALFFGIIAFVFTGMQLRRDRGVVSETFMAIPTGMARSLKQAIEEANPPSHLELARLSQLDADMAELDELADLLRRQPRAGIQPAIKERLEELAAKWLDDEALRSWLESVEPS